MWCNKSNIDNHSHSWMLWFSNQVSHLLWQLLSGVSPVGFSLQWNSISLQWGSINQGYVLKLKLDCTLSVFTGLLSVTRALYYFCKLVFCFGCSWPFCIHFCSREYVLCWFTIGKLSHKWHGLRMKYCDTKTIRYACFIFVNHKDILYPCLNLITPIPLSLI